MNRYIVLGALGVGVAGYAFAALLAQAATWAERVEEDGYRPPRLPTQRTAPTGDAALAGRA